MPTCSILTVEKLTLHFNSKLSVEVDMVIQKLIRYFGLVKRSDLDFARDVTKRLDEHRELCEQILSSTSLFNTSEPWHLYHAATQDDYLMYLFYLRHGVWPNFEGSSKFGSLRRRPTEFPPCSHPLYDPKKLEQKELLPTDKELASARRKWRRAKRCRC